MTVSAVVIIVFCVWKLCIKSKIAVANKNGIYGIPRKDSFT